jgi:imidazolonepropionase-like amidohydrolase
MSWADASRAGLRTIEHGQTVFENLQPELQLTRERFTALANELDGALGDEIFGVLKANGTFFDPTLIGYETTIDDTRAEVAAARREAYARMKRIAAKAARAGVDIITGTDVLERHGEMLHLELERLVEIGMTPSQVLTAATVTSSRAAGQPELGRVAVGAPASFLLVDANPLTDITHLRRLSGVVHGGQFLDAAVLDALKR